MFNVRGITGGELCLGTGCDKPNDRLLSELSEPTEPTDWVPGEPIDTDELNVLGCMNAEVGDVFPVTFIALRKS